MDSRAPGWLAVYAAGWLAGLLAGYGAGWLAGWRTGSLSLPMDVIAFAPACARLILKYAWVPIVMPLTTKLKPPS